MNQIMIFDLLTDAAHELSGNPSAEPDLAALLDSLPDTVTQQHLLEVLRDPASGELARQMSCAMLGSMGDYGAWLDLRHAQDDPDEQVREYADWALTKIDGEAGKAAGDLIDFLCYLCIVGDTYHRPAQVLP
ncbi:MAG: hypothetical protein JNJ61_25725 [Anaerolineae bacterium]|nr:hypothetical protein [Anaerolineae bacterium]